MSAKETAVTPDPEAQLREAREEIARLSGELEQLRRRAPPNHDELIKETRKRFTRFITDRVNPGYQERHHGNLASWPPELFQEAAQIGLFALGMSPALGGDGRDQYTTGIVLEELARMIEDPGFLIMIGFTKKCATAIATADREDLNERWVRAIIRGEYMATWGSWEPGDMGYMASTAKKVEGGWILNGHKPFITGAMHAQVFCIVVREATSGEPMLFLVTPKEAGVKVTPLATVGARHMGFGGLKMEDVKVSDDRLVLEGEALGLIASTIDDDVWSLCGVHLGWMQRMLGLCIDDVDDKVRNGQRFLDIPHVQNEIGRLRIGIEAARSLFLRVLELYRAGKADPLSEPLTITFKHFLTERTLDTAQTLMRLEGGAGYVDANPWGRYLTHVLCLLQVAGVQDMIPRIIGERYLAELALKKFKKKFTM